MKFTNKLFFNLFAVVMATMVLLACSKDDEVKPIMDKDNLVGTWVFESIDAGDGFANLLTSAFLSVFLEGSEITFESNGTYAIPGFFTEPIPGDSGTYTFDEKSNMLTFSADEKDGTVEVRELSSTKLILYIPEVEVAGSSDPSPATTLTYSKKP